MYQYSKQTIKYQNICLIILFLIQILPRSYPKCYFCFLFCFLFKVIAYILERFLKRREEPIAKRNTLAYLQIHSGTALPTIRFILLLILQRKEGGVGCLGEEPNPTTYNTTTYSLPKMMRKYYHLSWNTSIIRVQCFPVLQSGYTSVFWCNGQYTVGRCFQ